jgi:lantibiotic leader peptide-processing serine protease
LRLIRNGARLALALVTCAVALTFTASAGAARFLVVYRTDEIPAGAGAEVRRAGGTILARYDAIGIVVAESPDEGFGARIRSDARVVDLVARVSSDGAAADAAESAGPPSGDLPNDPAADADTFSSLQWNLRMIHAPEAHAITGGSPDVLVGHIDTGVDFLHADLAPNIDFAKSASCVSGDSDQTPAAWNDDSGHGTHTAGVIAAAANGIGVVGVAPNVGLAEVKASTRIGMRDFFFPDAVVCALVWAGDNHMDVANMSFSVDRPDEADMLDLWCHSNAADRAVIKAVQRAAGYARRNGVTLVAAAGNQGIDLADPPAPYSNECIKLPAELPGVIGVSSVGAAGEKASTNGLSSNFGLGVVDVAAPGGDPAQAGPPPANLILSTWPSSMWAPTVLCVPDTRPAVCPTPAVSPETVYYRYAAGTSQATAHVSGVAALVVSRFGDFSNSGNGKLRPGRVEAILEQTATPHACPPAPTTCEGGETNNGWYGHGIVDALAAVTHDVP